MDSLIKTAISEKRIIEFKYDGYQRIAEPHVHGILDGVYQLLVYQIGGRSSSSGIPNRRRFKKNKISKMVITGQTF
jgi:hypothetical protein